MQPPSAVPLSGARDDEAPGLPHIPVEGDPEDPPERAVEEVPAVEVADEMPRPAAGRHDVELVDVTVTEEPLPAALERV